MRSFKSASIIACLFLFLINTAQAAQDYNSSRSNKSSGITAPDDTDTLLKETSAEALAVAKSMIALDQKDGFEGQYTISVDVHVNIERVPSPRDAASGLATGKR